MFTPISLEEVSFAVLMCAAIAAAVAVCLVLLVHALDMVAEPADGPRLSPEDLRVASEELLAR